MIKSLSHVGLTVPELGVGRTFYEAFGLEAYVAGSDLVFRCQERAQDQIRLMQGSPKRLSYVAFGTDSEGFKKVLDNLERLGVAIQSAPYEIESSGIWFKDPSDDWVHVTIEDPATVATRNIPEVNTPGRYRRVNERACTPESQSKRAKPLRLGHLIKFTSDVTRSIEFYTQALGMKVSDQAGDGLAFLRCGSGGDHHVLGLAKSSHSGLHHLSFEVMDIDEIEMGAQHLVQLGYESAFGLGRHVAGSNYFHYIRDPWNSLVEYFWDIDVISENDTEWVPLNASPQDLTAVWAVSPPPPEFIQNFEEQT
ncbi:VOC family protein [Pseudomonas fluorescens]|uniref:VOC family protein n=1 Tax=Pseudomonas fluorescens TaxID=294 RepID=UPI003F9BF8B0